MPDATTPNYGWTLPTVGADFGTWGGFLNGNLSNQDTQVYSIQTIANAAMPKSGGTFTGTVLLPANYTMVNGLVGTSRILYWGTSGVPRWAIYANGAGEGGSNAGSDFAINSYTDLGAPIGQVLTISRATGVVTISNGLTVSSGATNINSLNVNGGLWVYPSGGASSIYLTGPPSTNRQFLYQTNGLSRWITYATPATEGAGNAGSDFGIGRYDNTGNYLDNPLSISRATGQVAIGPGGLLAAGNIQSNTALFINGANATSRALYYQTGGNPRWAVFCDAAAEGPGVVGSNFAIQGYQADGGGSAFQGLSISRATGQVTAPYGLNTPGAVNTGNLVVNDGSTSIQSIALTATSANGANFKMIGNGATTPSKTIRVVNGLFQIINSAYSASIFSMDDTGVATFSAIPLSPTPGRVSPYNTVAPTQVVNNQALVNHGNQLGPVVVVSGNWYPGFGPNSGGGGIYKTAGTNNCYLPGDGSGGTYTMINQSGGTVGIAGINSPFNTIPNNGAVIAAGDGTGAMYAIATAGYGSIGRTIEIAPSVSAYEFVAGEISASTDQCLYFTEPGEKFVTIPEEVMVGTKIEVSADPGATVHLAYSGTLRTVPNNRVGDHTLVGPGSVWLEQKKVDEIWLRGDGL